MATEGKTSEVGAEKPTDETNKEIDNLVDDVLAPPTGGPKSTLPKPEEGLAEEETEEQPGDKPGESSEESSDDDLIPSSKHNKILEKMQKRIDDIVAERDELRSKQESSSSQDSKLEALSTAELKELRENADEAIMDAKVAAKVDGADNTAKVNELRTLKRNIDKTLEDAPKRFQSRQMKNLKNMIEEVKDIDPEISEMRGELWNTAKKIFQRSRSLQQSETGQAEALAFAAEYYVDKKSSDNGREQASTLSKKVANLKRKTTLDSKTRNANQADVSSKKLRDKAIGGTYFDKLEYIQKNLVPDDFIQPQ